MVPGANTLAGTLPLLTLCGPHSPVRLYGQVSPMGGGMRPHHRGAPGSCSHTVIVLSHLNRKSGEQLPSLQLGSNDPADQRVAPQYSSPPLKALWPDCSATVCAGMRTRIPPPASLQPSPKQTQALKRLVRSWGLVSAPFWSPKLRSPKAVLALWAACAQNERPALLQPPPAPAQKGSTATPCIRSGLSDLLMGGPGYSRN